jgi:hypothetical protein
MNASKINALLAKRVILCSIGATIGYIEVLFNISAQKLPEVRANPTVK